MVTLWRGDGGVCVCVCVSREGDLSETGSRDIFQLLALFSLTSRRAGEAKSSSFISIRGLSPPPMQTSPSLSPAATVKWTQDHPNRICKPPNKVDCKRQNDMRDFFCGWGSFGEQWMSGGGKVTAKGQSRREVNILWLHLFTVFLLLQWVASLHY